MADSDMFSKPGPQNLLRNTSASTRAKVAASFGGEPENAGQSKEIASASGDDAKSARLEAIKRRMSVTNSEY